MRAMAVTDEQPPARRAIPLLGPLARAIRRRTRLRITLLYALVFALVATAAMATFWFAFVHAEFGAVDSALATDAQSLSAGLERSGATSSFGRHLPLPGESPAGVSVAAVLVAADGSTVLDRTGGFIAMADVHRLVTAALAGQTVTDTVSVSNVSSRVLAEPVTLGDGTTGALVLTRSVVELESILAEHAGLLALIDLGLVVAGSLLGYWVAGRALRPVRTMAATARDISERRLDRRIEVDLVPTDELGELAATFNAMLERLEASFGTLRRFTADAAHDLRAPLAMVRSEVEVTLAQRRTPEEYEQSLRNVLAETERLSRLADQLLLLARADAGALALRRERLDVADLVDETADRWQALATKRGISVTTAVPDSGEIVADHDLLRRLLDNLIDNAVRHTPPGGRVDVSAHAADARWHLDVRDTGDGIPAEMRSQVFERFSRRDAARGRETGGAGLGLAVCAVIAQLHGGSIIVVDDGPGAHLRVDLPA